MYEYACTTVTLYVSARSVDAITGSRCRKLSRIQAHACNNERDGEREKKGEREGDQSEFSQKRVPSCSHAKSTPSQRGGAVFRCSSHNRMYYEGA